MRQGNQSNRNNRQRSRGRRPSSSGGGGNAANKVYDSNGPDVRVRGSAQTVADKYLQLAGDAQSQGDRIKTESYFQHAEHYLRIVSANQAVIAQKQAEKDKAAEEHAARIAAKKAKSAPEHEAGTPVEQEKPAVEKAPQVEQKAPQVELNDDWKGPQPAFLKRDDVVVEPEKAKKPRRKPVKRKPVAKPINNGADSVPVVASKENPVEVSSSTEDAVVPETTIVS